MAYLARMFVCTAAAHVDVKEGGAWAQMGGAAGVRAQEEVRITLQPIKGLLMHCIPRSSP